MAGVVVWARFLVALLLGHFCGVRAFGGVQVQGRVLCQDCQKELSGNGTMETSQTPLQGAFVSLKCYDQTQQTSSFLVARTSKLGTFSVELKPDAPLNLECKARLLSSPSSKCNVKTNLNDGATGSIPIFDLVSGAIVGPFAFTPSYCQ
ncbi:hypothetical protein GOP47_0015829 [Adiantum capillus-veneris]|uniref:Pollen Ole e 1 allergen and extensin family protein n=1 Tax=Adiantum capillus-veneris TaxID=13818 RepID=A0A9D4ULJ7_ADICA|nr:hypothetical protein GOP47_0015829 [Adiantum capillus-veneris]